MSPQNEISENPTSKMSNSLLAIEMSPCRFWMNTADTTGIESWINLSQVDRSASFNIINWKRDFENLPVRVH